MSGAATDIRVLSGTEWRSRAAAHRDRLEQSIGPYLARRSAGAKDPVLDFLFTYYGHKPAQLRRWHPGYAVALEDAPEYADYRGYHRIPSAGPDTWTADPAFRDRRLDAITYVAGLLRATADRTPQLACFGLHEWAMVYRSEDVRHDQVPLRLGAAGTDAVVESMSLRCTHFDAYRFFTPAAAPRNADLLTREAQPDREQPGCLHATMDLYKWGFKLIPLVDSDLLLDCFEVACTARELDMRASPYDLTGYGYPPVRIETPSGRAEYARGQADLAHRAAPLRTRLLAAAEALVTAG